MTAAMMPPDDPGREVFLLGAGASVAAGFPSAAGLSGHLARARHALETTSTPSEILELIDKDLQWLQETQDRLRPLARRLGGFDPENIEDVFRIWGNEADLPATPSKLIPGYQYPRLIRMLALALAFCPRYPSLADFSRPNVYTWLIGELAERAARNRLKPVVVTTNYDLLIESAISARPDVDLTYISRQENGLNHVFERQEVATAELIYLKLHGSINWYGREAKNKVTRQSARMLIEADNPLATLAARYPGAGDNDIEMVPPAALKDIIYRVNWVDVWNEAYMTFCNCRSLVIIGYSFSQGDLLVHNLMTIGLARSPCLESITVIDPHAEEVIARIKSAFSEEFIAEKRWTAHARYFDDETPRWAALEQLLA